MPAAAEQPFAFLDRRWRWFLLLAWLVVAGFMLWQRWSLIRVFALGDTDDNMRIMQVRALLAGQGWYDLAQHRLAGSCISWSRPASCPTRSRYVVCTPLFGGSTAD